MAVRHRREGSLHSLEFYAALRNISVKF